MTDPEGSAQYPVECWSAGVDWITQVYDETRAGEQAWYRAMGWIEEAVAAGEKRQGFTLAGFRGQSAGGVSCSRSGSSVLVQVTSGVADGAFSVLSSIGGYPTRLDLALT